MKTIRDLPEEVKLYLSNLEFKHGENIKNIDEELRKFGYTIVDKESIGLYNSLQGYLEDEVEEVEGED